MAEPRAEEIEVALGGIYHLSDGRSFWMDALAVREILRRMQPFRAVQEAEIARLKAEVERWRSQSDAAEKAEAERAEKAEAELAEAKNWRIDRTWVEACCKLLGVENGMSARNLADYVTARIARAEKAETLLAEADALIAYEMSAENWPRPYNSDEILEVALGRHRQRQGGTVE